MPISQVDQYCCLPRANGEASFFDNSSGPTTSRKYQFGSSEPSNKATSAAACARVPATRIRPPPAWMRRCSTRCVAIMTCGFADRVRRQAGPAAPQFRLARCREGASPQSPPDGAGPSSFPIDRPQYGPEQDSTAAVTGPPSLATLGCTLLDSRCVAWAWRVRWQSRWQLVRAPEGLHARGES